MAASAGIAIIDTHVVVAGLLTASGESAVVHGLQGMLAPAFPYVVSEALIAEYRAVLLRPKLCRLHGLSPDEVDEILTALVQNAIVLAPTEPAGLRAPDPGDQFLWDLMAMREDLLLITGDQRLLSAADLKGRILSARQFFHMHP